MEPILIYGVPGTGKSTISQTLAKKLNYDYIGLDELRPYAKTKVSPEEKPFIFEYSTEAWKKFGVLNNENAVKGFLAVREAFAPFIKERLSQSKPNTVAEAVYAPPSTRSILIINPDEDLHYSRFFVNRPHCEEENTQFTAARYIQNYLIQEAAAAGLPIIKSNDNIGIIINILLPEVAKLVR